MASRALSTRFARIEDCDHVVAVLDERAEAALVRFECTQQTLLLGYVAVGSQHNVASAIKNDNGVGLQLVPSGFTQ